ncbi:uncharacterized protein F5891DRAFT_667198 [Suillus fuscotomentosus]|uniref:Uncharacterized protein n=1 Tax=Suillus fuscotomentosus TaxID=1912939 RepID=A0AAD4DWH8_9AGAM|nr:uncharacterized protein F5891DRAFT_667198 [Suillus fuscotomentosus]KAG1895448.1 hypothetical protein F5891DRAFT_667198 [Suillus fuscotomentosus]
MFHMPRTNVIASARERWMKITPLKPGNPAASSSRPPNSNTTQHSNGTSEAQSLHAQAAVSPSTAPPAVINTPSSANPHVTIRHAGAGLASGSLFVAPLPSIPLIVSNVSRPFPCPLRRISPISSFQYIKWRHEFTEHFTYHGRFYVFVVVNKPSLITKATLLNKHVDY